MDNNPIWLNDVLGDEANSGPKKPKPSKKEQDKNSKSKKEDRSGQETYIPAPKTGLPAWPDAVPLKRGKGQRPGWRLPSGELGEWDSKKGEVEIYDKTGKKHKGGFDPRSGEKRSPEVPGRKSSRSKIEVPNADEIQNSSSPSKYIDKDALKKGTEVGIGTIIILTLTVILVPG